MIENLYLDFVFSPWTEKDGIKQRRLEYKSEVDGIGSTKICHTFDEEVINL